MPTQKAGQCDWKCRLLSLQNLLHFYANANTNAPLLFSPSSANVPAKKAGQHHWKCHLFPLENWLHLFSNANTDALK